MLSVRKSAHLGGVGYVTLHGPTSGLQGNAMYREDGTLHCSPSDLTVYLDSEFASWMDRWHLEQRCAGGNGSRNGVVDDAAPGPFKDMASCACARDEKDEGAGADRPQGHGARAGVRPEAEDGRV